MAAVNSNEILGTWKALSSILKNPGWQSIDLFQAGTCRIKLARHSPGNEEAILIGFSSARIAPTPQLPKGQGFRIERLSLREASSSHNWLAIIKQPAGSLELFAAVVSDIAELLGSPGEPSEEEMYQQLLGRVRGWQEFMRQGHEGLSKEAEQGLIAELCFLRSLIDEGVLLYSAIDGWKGPLDGLHDFQIGIGSIEVKSSLATEGFPVRIASLDQLDDSQAPPLFLAAFRLEIIDTGMTLPEYVAGMRETLKPDPAASNIFEVALHEVGYLDMQRESYFRRFSPRELRILLVDFSFPRLIPFNVPPSIRQAQYELDLSLLVAAHLPLSGVLNKLGVI